MALVCFIYVIHEILGPYLDLQDVSVAFEFLEIFLSLGVVFKWQKVFFEILNE